MPNQYNIFVYSLIAFGISVAFFIYGLLNAGSSPHLQKFYYLTSILTLVFGVITYFFRPKRLEKDMKKAWRKAMPILEKLNEDGHFNHEPGETRIADMVKKSKSCGLREEDIDELYDLVPACLLPPYHGTERRVLDWHRFELCIVAADQDMDLARRVVKELRKHYPQLRVYVDDEQVIGPQEKLIKRTYYSGSRLCLALISVHLIHDPRRKVELNNARLRVKDMSNTRRITGSSDNTAYLKPIPLDEHGRSFMEKAKDLAPFVKLFPLIQDRNHLSRVVVNSILRELEKVPHLLLVNTPNSDRPEKLSIFPNPEITHKVFISYSRKDEAFARHLYDDLQDKGIDCWFAPEDLTIGATIRDAIEDALRLHCKLVLILTENAIKSLWVHNEVELAYEKERDSGKRILFPIKIDNSIEYATAAWARTLRRQRHIGDFTGWENPLTYKRALERLVQALQSE